MLSQMAGLQAVELSFLPWNEEVAGRKLSLAVGEDEEREISYLHPHARGEVFQVTGSAVIRLLSPDRKSEGGEMPALTLPMPAGATRVLCLLLPAEEHATGLRALVLDDSPEGFAWGTLRTLNATGQPVILTWEKQFRQLPASAKPVDIKPGGRTRHMQVRLYAKKTDPRPLYSAVWKYDENLRQLLLILPGKDRSQGVADFRFITEDRRALSEEKKQ
ncbi:MAG: hypothetical protein ACQKBY_11495 [Verrucomicrobiales bacterium]